MCNEKWNLQGNRVDLEVITLCEVTQTQKDRFHTVLAEADPSFWCFCVYMCGWGCGKGRMKQEGDHKKGKRSFEGRSLGRKRREDYWGRKVQLRGWPEDRGRGDSTKMDYVWKCRNKTYHVVQQHKSTLRSVSVNNFTLVKFLWCLGHSHVEILRPPT